MAYARGRFGIEYTPGGGRDDTPHPLRGVLFVLGLAVAVSFGWARWTRYRDARPVAEGEPDVAEAVQPPAEPTLPPPEPAAAPAAAAPAPAPDPKTNRVARTPPPAPPKAPPAPAAAPTPDWLVKALRATEADMPGEYALLRRLADAEQAGKFDLAVDSIEKLLTRPALAHLADVLSRRLGALNMQLLLSGRPTRWTATVTVRRGDNLRRLAREHGCTYAAVLKLNPKVDPNRLRTGQRIRLLEFPRAQLVIHRSSRYADLTLRGRFFSRYYARPGAKTPVGPFPVTREIGPRMRLAELGVTFVPGDLAELDIFLAPGGGITVADP